MTLHKHHVIPKSLGGSDSPDNLVEICPNCHEDRHHGPFGGHLSHTPQASEKRIETMRRRWGDSEYRNRMSAHLRKPENQATRLAGLRAWFAIPENHDQVAERFREISSRPERNRKISESNKKIDKQPPRGTSVTMAHARKFLNTETARAHWEEAMREVRADPEYRKVRQRTMKNRWLDPEYRARVLAARGQGGMTCQRGHSMSGENLYIDARGRRVCKTCKTIKSKESRARRKA